MSFKITREAIEQTWTSCLDMAIFTGVGYLSGRVVNWFAKWGSKPSFFGKPNLADLRSVTACCLLFITIDRLIHSILLQGLTEEKVNLPAHSAVRIGLSMAGTIVLFNALSSRLKLPTVELKMASAVILTTVVAYTHLLFILNIYNQRK